MNICKRCGAHIEWITAADSSLVPVHEEPVFVLEGAGTERFLTDEGNVITGRPARRDEETSTLPVAFVPHRWTCPNAAGFWREPVKPP